MPLYARRTDANHEAVREAMRKCGWTILDLSMTGDGAPDLLAIRNGRVVFVEVKDGAKSPSRRALTPRQVAVHAQFAAAGVPIYVVTSVEEAVNL